MISPNLKVLSDWRSTTSVAFSVLRRIAFIKEDDFKFGDFDPKTTFRGMGTADYVIYRARFLKVFKLLFLSLDLSVTVSAPLTFGINIELPEGTTAAAGAGGGQSFCIYVNGTPGTAVISEEQSNLRLDNAGFTNFGAGGVRIIGNGFLEVI
jgi:hypothetical protein